MPSARELADARGGGGGANLLHGADVKKPQIEVTIVAAREAPATFKSPIILDIEEVIPGKTAIALNVTNTRALAEMLGDDFYKWPGAKVTFARVPQRNPQTNVQTWGLAVVAATAAKTKVKKTRHKEDDDIPF